MDCVRALIDTKQDTRFVRSNQPSVATAEDAVFNALYISSYILHSRGAFSGFYCAPAAYALCSCPSLA